jgi:hypothetical protein
MKTCCTTFAVKILYEIFYTGLHKKLESLKRVKAITGQKHENHTIRTVFFITVSKYK